MDVRVSVCYKAFASVQPPAGVLLVIGGLQHYALEVGTSVGLRQVHRHCLTCAYAWDVFASLFLVSEAEEGLDAVLERPYVLESGISRAHDFVGCGIYRDWQVESAVAAWHRHAVESCLGHGVEVLVCLARIAYASTLAVWAFCIHVFCVGGYDVGCDVSHHVEYLVVAVHGIGVVLRSLVVCVLVLVAALFQFHDALHEWIVLQFELNLWNVCIKICHFAYLLFCL